MHRFLCWAVVIQIMFSQHLTGIIPFLSDYHHLDALGGDNGTQFHHILQDIKLFLLNVLYIPRLKSSDTKLNN